MQEFDAAKADPQNQEGPGLNMEEFVSAMTRQLGCGITAEQLALLFMKIDTSCDGRVDWDEFCSYMMLEYEKNQPTEGGLKLNESKPFTTGSVHRRQIVFAGFTKPKKWAEASNHGQLVSVDCEGLFCKWHCNFETTSQRIQLSMPVSKPHVTSVVFLPVVNLIAIGLMNRSIRFYDASCTTITLVCEVTGLPHSPMSMDTAVQENDKVLLIYGDAGGFINHLHFLQIKRGLFGKHVDHIECDIHYRNLVAGANNCNQFASLARRKIHSEWVTKVKCWKDKGVFVSCCTAREQSMVVGDMEHNFSVFDVTKGVDTFDINVEFSSIVTGGRDCLVRVWNQRVPCKPCAVLEGHKARICSIVLAVTDEPTAGTVSSSSTPHDLDAYLGRVISMSEDHVLKLWDVADQVCLQTITNSNLPQRIPCQVMLLQVERNALFIANQTLQVIRTNKKTAPKMSQSFTHAHPISAARYNPLFGQVVTACRGSVVNVWNVSTGEQMVQFGNAHGDAEITTMIFDQSFRRLYTGAGDGSAKVWNFNVGLSLYKLQNSSKSEITGIYELKNKTVVTAGWGRKVTFFKPLEDEYHVDPQPGIEGLGHVEDIQCLERCTDNLIATCSYDGVIMLWQIGKSSITNTLKINTSVAHPGVPSATERLLCLTNRCRTRGGSLVASGLGGWIRCWNVYSGELAGSFQIVTPAHGQYTSHIVLHPNSFSKNLDLRCVFAPST